MYKRQVSLFLLFVSSMISFIRVLVNAMVACVRWFRDAVWFHDVVRSLIPLFRSFFGSSFSFCSLLIVPVFRLFGNRVDWLTVYGMARQSRGSRLHDCTSVWETTCLKLESHPGIGMYPHSATLKGFMTSTRPPYSVAFVFAVNQTGDQ